MDRQDNPLIGKIAFSTVEDVFMNQVSQIASKSLIKEITVQTSKYPWTDMEKRLTRHALSLSLMIEDVIIDKPKDAEMLQNASIRLATFWEYVAKLSETAPKSTSLINAAILYEIGGHQANATCLAKTYFDFETEASALSHESSLMLQRLFFKLKDVSAEHLKEPKEKIDEFTLKIKLGTAIASVGFEKLADYFLTGNESHMNESIQCIEDAEKLFSVLGFVEESNLLHSVRSLLPIMKNKSTWEILKQYAKTNFIWTRYLTLLARGLGRDIENNVSISELWPSQIEALKKGLLTTHTSKIIRMPTSAGKTRIAEMGIIDALITNPGSNCIYIAPFKSLVSEIEDTFLNIFNDLGFRVSVVVGDYEKDLFEKNIINNADILVVTPEKLDLLLRTHSEFLEKTSLFIMDESHIVNSKNRGIKLEILLSRLRKKYPDTRFLMLSAVLSDETINDFLEWFNVLDTGLISSDWKPTIQQHAGFRWENDVGTLRFLPTSENQLMELAVPEIIMQKEYVTKNIKTGHKTTKIFPTAKKSETTAELGFKFAALGPVLISTTQPRWVESIAKELEKKLKYTEDIEEQIPPYFKNINRVYD